MNILFCGLLLLSTNILQGYQQFISPSKDVTVTLNQDLTLTWLFSGSTDFKIRLFGLYKDNYENEIHAGKDSELTRKGKEIFGDRFVIEKKDISAGVFITKLKNFQFNDTGTIFILEVVYNIEGTLFPRRSAYTITKVQDPSSNVGGGGTAGESSGDSNVGLIAGVIIELIFLIIIVVVCYVLFKRYKKNKRRSYLDGSGTNLRNGTNDNQYTETPVAMEQYDSEKKRHVANEYVKLRPGGGHYLPKAKSNPTHYHEVKLTDDGENVRPTRDAPPKPIRGNVISGSDGNLVSDIVEV